MGRIEPQRFRLLRLRHVRVRQGGRESASFEPHAVRVRAGRVARRLCEPGDLVFFYNPIHHVGIYIGGGKMIHAAGTGKDVRISSVWTTPTPARGASNSDARLAASDL